MRESFTIRKKRQEGWSQNFLNISILTATLRARRKFKKKNLKIKGAIDFNSELCI